MAELARDDRLHADLGEPRGQPADEAGEPRRHHRGRRLSLADPRPLCRSRWRRELGGRAAPLHAVERRPRRRAALPRQGRDPVGPGGRHRRRGAHRGDGRASTRSSASTWAAPRPTCRITPASTSARFETVVAGVRMRAPMMHIHTVAAGGGSICIFDGARYRVGPESAGADPGPGLLSPRRAAHRHRLQRDARQARSRDFFPHVFGPGGDEPLDRDVVAQKFAALAAEIAARDRRRARARRGRRGLPPDRRREHGERDQADLDRARLRRDANTRSAASAARAGSMPAWSPTRSA